jgi:hypothetical protein
MRAAVFLSLHETLGVDNFAAMFRAGEAENRVVHSDQKLRMASLKTASQRTFVLVLDDVVANESPKLAW